jgi:hypothetical protein
MRLFDMWLLCFFWFAFADPYWETKAPADWTIAEVQQLLSDSPWAQMPAGTGRMPGPPVQVYFATAEPIVQAEHERALRTRTKGQDKPGDNAMADEYRIWMEENRATQIVVAVRTSSLKAFSDATEIRRLEEDCVIKAGKKKYKLTGHFPPWSGDPYLRLAFPRKVELSDKTLILEIYVPGLSGPFRELQFPLKDMVYKGKLEL